MATDTLVTPVLQRVEQLPLTRHHGTTRETSSIAHSHGSSLASTLGPLPLVPFASLKSQLFPESDLPAIRALLSPSSLQAPDLATTA